VADTSLSVNADSDMNVQGVAVALLSPEDNSQVEISISCSYSCIEASREKSSKKYI
jgi:hypothetical protein